MITLSPPFTAADYAARSGRQRNPPCGQPASGSSTGLTGPILYRAASAYLRAGGTFGISDSAWASHLVEGEGQRLETGIHLPGRFGVRIEDIVTDGGDRRFNNADRALQLVE